MVVVGTMMTMTTMMMMQQNFIGLSGLATGGLLCKHTALHQPHADLLHMLFPLRSSLFYQQAEKKFL